MNDIAATDGAVDAPWPLEWTPDHVRRFWNWRGQRPDESERYFARMAGQSLVEYVKRHVDLSGLTVDWGAGPGHLLHHLLRAGAAQVWALDTSAVSVDALRHQFRGVRGFAGASVLTEGRMPDLPGEADLVFLVETVEHLDDHSMESTMRILRSSMRTGARLVVTTPNHENLDDMRVMCPHCMCVFHSMQHVRSFDEEALANTMESYGFEREICRPILFSEYRPPLSWLQRAKYRVLGQRLPRLLFVGRASDPA